MAVRYRAQTHAFKFSRSEMAVRLKHKFLSLRLGGISARQRSKFIKFYAAPRSEISSQISKYGGKI
jgi:hypothetical protein